MATRVGVEQSPGRGGEGGGIQVVNQALDQGPEISTDNSPPTADDLVTDSTRSWASQRWYIGEERTERRETTDSTSGRTREHTPPPVFGIYVRRVALGSTVSSCIEKSGS